ncbi:MAG: hypothetical protein ACXVDD_00745 [Polyangia bacterium]
MTARLPILAFTVIALGATARAEGPSLRLGGQLFSYVRVHLYDPADFAVEQASTSAWLTLRARLSPAVSVRAVATLDLVHASVLPQPTVRGDLREAVLTAVRGGLELRLGQQFVVWGNGDGVSPNDRLTARDYTFFSAEAEVQRIGAPAALLTFVPDGGAAPLAVTVAVVAVAPRSRLLVPAGVLPAGIVDLGEARGAPSLADAELALRAGYQGRGWDLAMLGFAGLDALPYYALADVNALGVEIERRQQRIVSAGLYGSTARGPWALRWDTAYVAASEVGGSSPLVPPSRWETVIGVERPLGERVRISAQVVYRRMVGRRPPSVLADPIDRAIAEANALLHDTQDDDRPAATARIAYSSETEVFQAELAGAVNFVGFDFWLRAFVTYRVWEHLALRAGVEIFEGPRTRPLGALRDFSGAFTEARVQF